MSEEICREPALLTVHDALAQLDLDTWSALLGGRGSQQVYLADYVQGEAASQVRDDALRVVYLDYDWSLNGER